MAWAQPNVPGGQYLPPVPVPDGAPPPPGTVIVATGPVPPPPPGLPPAPGYQPTGAVPGGSTGVQAPGTSGGLPGFWPGQGSTGGGGDVTTTLAAGSAGAVAGMLGNVPLAVVAIGALLAAFILYGIVSVAVKAFMAGGVSIVGLLFLGLPILLLMGGLLLWAFSGAGGPNMTILLIFAAVLFVFLPLFALMWKAFPAVLPSLCPP